MQYLVIYLKPNDVIVARLVKHIHLEVNEFNSYDWLVISVFKEYCNEFLLLKEVKRRVRIDIEKENKRREKKKKMIKILEFIKNAI